MNTDVALQYVNKLFSVLNDCNILLLPFLPVAKCTISVFRRSFHYYRESLVNGITKTDCMTAQLTAQVECWIVAIEKQQVTLKTAAPQP